MTVFQFEECSSAGSFIRRCNKQGLASARKFKKKHRNKGIQDPEMLRLYLVAGRVLVTFDRKMIIKHEKDIPQRSPGIIIIRHSPAIPYTLTQRSAEKIIGGFKQKLSDWHQIPWANSIVEITDQSVTIFRKEESGLVNDCSVGLSEENCDQTIRAHLIHNSRLDQEEE